MKHILCAGVIFSTDGKLLLEDRRKICKHGEEWSFFGGKVEEGETPEEAMVREIKEELSLDITKYEFFKEYNFFVPEKDLKLTYYMYSAEIPDLNQLKVHEKADLEIFNFDDALKLKTTDFDKQIIIEFRNYSSSK